MDITHLPRWYNRCLLFLQVALVIGYLGAAVPKLGNDPRTIASFADLHVSVTGMHAIGVLEIAGALGLMIPRLVGAAAAALAALMVGAVSFTVVYAGATAAVAPAAFLAVAALVAWGRRDRTAQLIADLTRILDRPPAQLGQSLHG